MIINWFTSLIVWDRLIIILYLLYIVSRLSWTHYIYSLISSFPFYSLLFFNFISYNSINSLFLSYLYPFSNNILTSENLLLTQVVFKITTINSFPFLIKLAAIQGPAVPVTPVLIPVHSEDSNNLLVFSHTIYLPDLVYWFTTEHVYSLVRTIFRNSGSLIA